MASHDISSGAGRTAAIQASAAEVIRRAQALLKRIDNLTTREFELGGEREEREALRTALDSYARTAVVLDAA